MFSLLVGIIVGISYSDGVMINSIEEGKINKREEMVTFDLLEGMFYFIS